MNKEEIAKSIDEGLKILKQEPSFIFYPEEIKAIEKLKHHIEFTKKFPSECFDTEIKIALNYICKLQKELEQEKEKNKKLNLENQALFESINCNDDNMLARRYSNLQKELDKKDICLKACEDNLIKERQLRIKQDKVINCLIDLLQQEGYLKFDNREQAIDYIDKLIKVEEEND